MEIRSIIETEYNPHRGPHPFDECDAFVHFSTPQLKGRTMFLEMGNLARHDDNSGGIGQLFRHLDLAGNLSVNPECSAAQISVDTARILRFLNAGNSVAQQIVGSYFTGGNQDAQSAIKWSIFCGEGCYRFKVTMPGDYKENLTGAEVFYEMNYDIQSAALTYQLFGLAGIKEIATSIKEDAGSVENRTLDAILKNKESSAALSRTEASLISISAKIASHLHTIRNDIKRIEAEAIGVDNLVWMIYPNELEANGFIRSEHKEILAPSPEGHPDRSLYLSFIDYITPAIKSQSAKLSKEIT